jgi:chemotaxis protein CheD
LSEIASCVKEFQVGLGMMLAVKERSILSIPGLGSCVGLALRDVVSGIGGLAHVVLPDSKECSDVITWPGKYADTAVNALVKRMLSLGAEVLYLRAKLVGGANVLTSGGFDGSKNANRVRAELSAIPIKIIAEDLGSNLSRSMRFDTGNWKITIRRFHQRDGIAELKDTIVI